MDPGLFEKIATEIALHPDCTVKIVGLGEPALHPQLGLLMDLLTRHKITAYLYTNGELFKRFSPEEITSWSVRNLTVSIDGLDPESFARIRVGGDYLEIKKALTEYHRARTKLRRRGPEVEIRHVIFPNETPADLLRFREEWLAISDTVKFNYLYYPASPVGEVRDTKCRDIRRELYIHWNGSVPLCGYQYLSNTTESLGEIRHASIAELWNHPRLREVRKYHNRRDLEGVPFCKACTFK
jgi:MoaA/NifB/PqqE/SkfB family radical SAM enzyme